MSATRKILLDAAEHVARLETALAASEAEARTYRQQYENAEKVLDRWEPMACSFGPCRNLVPTPAQVEQFRSLGATWDETKGFAWNLGYCCAEHHEQDNVIPFVRASP